MRSFSREVSSKLQHYVYLYLDPTCDKIFYIGKGTGNRAFFHLEDVSESEKRQRIQAIRRMGQEPRIEILAHGLTEDTAYRVESAAIDLLDKKRLTNSIGGWHSGEYGRMSVEQIAAFYGAREANITDPCILICINELFRYGMTDVELYDATRGIWRIGPKRDKAEFALAVFDGVVQEAYQIQGWFPAGSTLSTRGNIKGSNRWEFVGRIAPENVRRRYRFKSVRRLFPRGAQNPIRYVNLNGDENGSD